MDLREKVTKRLDDLQALLEANQHLENPKEAVDLIHRISPFWSILSEEDRDYVQCAQHAIEEGAEWNV